MLLSHTSEVATQVVVHLALQPPGKLIPVHQIARSTGLPKSFLAKIVGRLIRARLLRAFRGPGGGVELGRPAEEICLWSLVRAMEGPVRRERCVFGLTGCSVEKPCPLHPRWSQLRAEMQRLLEETTVGSVAHGLRNQAEPAPESQVQLPGGAHGVSD